MTAVDRFLRREWYAAGVTGLGVRPPEAPPVALLDVPMELSEDLWFPAGRRVHAAARVGYLLGPMPAFPAADAPRCITWVQSEVSVGTIHILVVVVVRCGTSRRGWSHKGSSEKTKGHPEISFVSGK